MQDPQKELEKIEFSYRTYKSKIYRELEIWEDIAMEINSNTGENQKFWCLVMELYHKKYSS